MYNNATESLSCLKMSIMCLRLVPWTYNHLAILVDRYDTLSKTFKSTHLRKFKQHSGWIFRRRPHIYKRLQIHVSCQFFPLIRSVKPLAQLVQTNIVQHFALNAGKTVLIRMRHNDGGRRVIVERFRFYFTGIFIRNELKISFWFCFL